MTNELLSKVLGAANLYDIQVIDFKHYVAIDSVSVNVSHGETSNLITLPTKSIDTIYTILQTLSTNNNGNEQSNQ